MCKSVAAASNPRIDQVARWHQAVCVQVTGLPQAGQAAQVAARIEQVARDVGLKVQAPGCSSNIQILFTDQPQKMADQIGEPYLGFHYKINLKRVRRPCLRSRAGTPRPPPAPPALPGCCSAGETAHRSTRATRPTPR